VSVISRFDRIAFEHHAEKSRLCLILLVQSINIALADLITVLMGRVYHCLYNHNITAQEYFLWKVMNI